MEWDQGELLQLYFQFSVLQKKILVNKISKRKHIKQNHGSLVRSQMMIKAVARGETSSTGVFQMLPWWQDQAMWDEVALPALPWLLPGLREPGVTQGMGASRAHLARGECLGAQLLQGRVEPVTPNQRPRERRWGWGR